MPLNALYQQSTEVDDRNWIHVNYIQGKLNCFVLMFPTFDRLNMCSK